MLRNAFSHLCSLALWGLAGITLAGFAGAAWWGFDLFCHFRLQYAVVATFLGLLLLVLRRRRSALFAAALACTNLASVASLYFPLKDSLSAAERTNAPALRVMSANVFKGNRRIDKVLDYVRRENPDVLVLLEIGGRWARPLERLSSRYPYRWVHPGNAYTGIAVLSRSVPVQTRVIDLARSGGLSLLLTFDRDGQRFSILGTHLKSPPGLGAAAIHEKELAALATVAREHPWPLLVIGDLNTTAYSPTFARLLREGGLKSCSRGLHYTWPVQAPPLAIQIDHCLARPGIELRDFTVGPDVGSDHFPISVSVYPSH